MIMKKEDIKIMDRIAKTNRNWTRTSRLNYNTAITRYTEFNNKSLKELIQEAEKEDKEGIRWNERKLRERLLNFRAFLYDKYILRTAKAYFKRVTVVYKDLGVEIKDLPGISDKNAKVNPPIYYEDLPTNEKIRWGCDVSDPLMTAVLIFMSSSGQARKETLNLTIRDFMKATQKYHSVEVATIVNPSKYEGAVLSKPKKIEIIEDGKIITDPKKILNRVCMDLIVVKEKMYPDFEIKRDKTGKYYRTICSDEATRAIVNYLLTRTDKIDFDKRLFKTNPTYFYQRFQDINEKLGLGKLESGINKFTSHMLRRFHASNLAKSIENPDSTTEKGMKEKEIDGLQGREKSGSRKSYFFNDYQGLRARYIQYSDRLKIYTNENKDFRTDQYKELEKELEDKLNQKNKIISNMAGENIHLKKENEELSTVKNEVDKINDLLTPEVMQILKNINKN